MSDSVEEKALKNDFREFLDSWKFGEVHIDAILKACERIVRPIESKLSSYPEVQRGIAELESAIKTLKSRQSECVIIASKVETLRAEADERRGAEKVWRWIIGALGATGALLGGVNALR